MRSGGLLYRRRHWGDRGYESGLAHRFVENLRYCS